jgi:hypothetical protein
MRWPVKWKTRPGMQDLYNLAFRTVGDADAGSVAVHEAGHAVVSLVYGMPVRVLWIEDKWDPETMENVGWHGAVEWDFPDGEWYFHTENTVPSIRQWLTVSVAGAVADGRPWDISSFLRNCPQSFGDWPDADQARRRAIQLLMWIRQPVDGGKIEGTIEDEDFLRLIELAERRARKIISRHWAAILKLASALVCRKSHRLTGRAARGLVEPLS